MGSRTSRFKRNIKSGNFEYDEDCSGELNMYDTLQTIKRRSLYYNKLGIKHQSRGSSIPRGGVTGLARPRLICNLSKNNQMNQTQENMDIGLLQNKLKKPNQLTRSSSGTRLGRFQSFRISNVAVLNKKNSGEESKDTMNNENTFSSTPDKSMLESNDSEVFASFILPEVNDYQIEYRKKGLLRTASSDHDLMRHKFLNKLTQSKVWLVPREKPKSHQT
jgi:hypothetical protein